MSEQRRYTAEEAAEIADRAVLESMLEEGCSWADAIRAKIREAFALPPWRYTEEDMNAEREREKREREKEVPDA